MTNKRHPENDFHIRVLENERLLTTIPEADIGLDEYLENDGNKNDLPDSDRIMICQRKGLNIKRCLQD